MNNLLEEIKINKGILSKLTVIVYRYGNFVFYKFKIPVLKKVLWIVYKILDFLVLRILGNSEIHAKTRIGKRFCIPHGPNGIIIHPDSILGDDVVIYHQVTIGINPYELKKSLKAPVIGNEVFIYPGAKIIGNVRIGNSSKVGVNSVVTRDVPNFSISAGVPNKIIKQDV